LFLGSLGDTIRYGCFAVSRDLIEGGIGVIDEEPARECNAVMSRVFTV